MDKLIKIGIYAYNIPIRIFNVVWKKLFCMAGVHDWTYYRYDRGYVTMKAYDFYRECNRCKKFQHSHILDGYYMDTTRPIDISKLEKYTF